MNRIFSAPLARATDGIHVSLTVNDESLFAGIPRRIAKKAPKRQPVAENVSEPVADTGKPLEIDIDKTHGKRTQSEDCYPNARVVSFQPFIGALLASGYTMLSGVHYERVMRKRHGKKKDGGTVRQSCRLRVFFKKGAEQAELEKPEMTARVIPFFEKIWGNASVFPNRKTISITASGLDPQWKTPQNELRIEKGSIELDLTEVLPVYEEIPASEVA